MDIQFYGSFMNIEEAAMFSLIPEDISPMGLAYIALRVGGVMNHKGRPWSLIVTIYQNLMLFIVLVSLTLEVYLSEETILYKVQAALLFLIIFHLFTKFVNILAHQREVQNLIDKIDEIRLEALMDPDAKEYILQADASAKNFTKKLTLITMFYVPSSYVFCILNFYFSSNPSPDLILPCWVPWEHKEFGKYVAAQTVVLVMSCTTTSAIIICYILLCTITNQLTAFIKALQSALEKNPMNRNIHRQHVNIIQLLNQFNTLFSGQLYLEIMISTFQPCGFGYMAIMLFRRNDPRFLDALYKFFLTCGFPFILCTCGQEVSTEMEKLHYSAYMGPWDDSPPTVRKNLLQLMAITGQPQALNYKKLITFNLPAFTKVAQGIYSYLAMMINLETS